MAPHNLCWDSNYRPPNPETGFFRPPFEYRAIWQPDTNPEHSALERSSTLDHLIEFVPLFRKSSLSTTMRQNFAFASLTVSATFKTSFKNSNENAAISISSKLWRALADAWTAALNPDLEKVFHPRIGRLNWKRSTDPSAKNGQAKILKCQSWLRSGWVVWRVTRLWTSFTRSTRRWRRWQILWPSSGESGYQKNYSQLQFVTRFQSVNVVRGNIYSV